MTTRHAVTTRLDRRDLPGETETWQRLHAVIDQLTPETASIAGYYEEGWTAKDAVAHLGTWMAEGAAVLHQVAAGTYREGELDVDAANAKFLDAMSDIPFELVHLQCASAHSELKRAWIELPEISPPAEFWARKAGPDHLEEHLPRLEAWVEELIAS